MALEAFPSMEEHSMTKTLQESTPVPAYSLWLTAEEIPTPVNSSSPLKHVHNSMKSMLYLDS
jgi:hypothetical protein